MARGNHGFDKSKLVYQSQSGISEDKMEFHGLHWWFALELQTAFSPVGFHATLKVNRSLNVTSSSILLQSVCI